MSEMELSPQHSEPQNFFTAHSILKLIPFRLEVIISSVPESEDFYVPTLNQYDDEFYLLDATDLQKYYLEQRQRLISKKGKVMSLDSPEQALQHCSIANAAMNLITEQVRKMLFSGERNYLDSCKLFDLVAMAGSEMSTALTATSDLDLNFFLHFSLTKAEITLIYDCIQQIVLDTNFFAKIDTAAGLDSELPQLVHPNVDIFIWTFGGNSKWEVLEPIYRERTIEPSVVN